MRPTHVASRSPIALLLLFAACCTRIASAQANTPPTVPTPTYDVTTIKPHKPDDNRSMTRWQSATYEATNTSLKGLIASAYDVRMWLIFGLPPWAESARYDIQAKISDGDPSALKKLTSEQHQAMILGLLHDRFSLQAHMESKSQPVYELSVLPEGVKFHQSLPLPPGEGEPASKRNWSMNISNGKLTAKRMPIAIFASNLSYQVERVIMDKTGLTGEYDFELTWTPEDKAGKEVDNGTGDTPPAIFTALKEQLGLKLTPAKAPVPTVVVDKVVPPEEN
jgi:uncharacterized protein (TIGR03435 family)